MRSGQIFIFYFCHAEFSARLHWKCPAAFLLLSDLLARLPLPEINPNLEVWRDLLKALKESDRMDEPSVVFSLFVYSQNPKLVTRRRADWPGAQTMKQGPHRCPVLRDRHAQLCVQPFSGMCPDPRPSVPPWPRQGVNDHSKKAKIPKNRGVWKDLRKIS